MFAPLASSGLTIFSGMGEANHATVSCWPVPEAPPSRSDAAFVHATSIAMAAASGPITPAAVSGTACARCEDAGCPAEQTNSGFLNRVSQVRFLPGAL